MDFPGQVEYLGAPTIGVSSSFPERAPSFRSPGDTPLVASSPTHRGQRLCLLGCEGWLTLSLARDMSTWGVIGFRQFSKNWDLHTSPLSNPTRQAGGHARHDRCLAPALDRMKKRRTALGQVAENSGRQLRGVREMAERGSPGPGGFEGRLVGRGGCLSVHFRLSSDVYLLVRAGARWGQEPFVCLFVCSGPSV